jgi:hypothetical protein
MLLEESIPVSRIIERTGLVKATIYRIKQIAIQRAMVERATA